MDQQETINQTCGLSYPRYIITEDNSIKSLHLALYKKMRNYLKNINSKFQITKQQKLEFNYSEKGIIKESILIQEYEKFFLNPQIQKLHKESIQIPYQVVQMKSSHERKVLDYDSSKKIPLLPFTPTNTKMVASLKVIFHQNIRDKDLLLNNYKTYYKSINEQKGYSNTINLEHCFESFTEEEILDEQNLWYCAKCKKHQQACKKMQLFFAPEVLILHLKRFKTTRINSIGSFYYPSSGVKITGLVTFPVQTLNLEKYILHQELKQSAIYDLFAVSNHYGSLLGGHYTAMAQNWKKHQWYEFDDTRISKIKTEDIVTDAAYLLFYKRRVGEKKAFNWKKAQQEFI